MVGSRGYFDTAIDGQYNIATAKRQPGSSFKPFAYATAFEKGFLPETVVFDVPTEFSTQCTWDQRPTSGHTRKDCYNPANYDNLFKGLISMVALISCSVGRFLSDTLLIVRRLIEIK
jgi:penicillin-binding protein 1A